MGLNETKELVTLFNAKSLGFLILERKQGDVVNKKIYEIGQEESFSAWKENTQESPGTWYLG